MVKLGELIAFAENMEEKNIELNEKKCTVMRTSKSQCSACVDACPSKALMFESVTFGTRRLILDESSCVNCGACINVCPSHALYSAKLSDAMIAQDIRKAYANPDNDKSSLICTCARMAARHQVSPEAYASFPCLACLDETLLLEFCVSLKNKQRLKTIYFIDGNCSTCKHRVCNRVIEKTVYNLNALFDAGSTSIQIVRSSEFPQFLENKTYREIKAEERRGFFSQCGTLPMSALEAGAQYMKQKDNPLLARAEVQDLLSSVTGEDAKTAQGKKHERLVNALYALGPYADSDTVAGKQFVRFKIDADVCDACNLCYLYCTEDAIKKSKKTSSETGTCYYEFSASDCNVCGICKDVCPKHCISFDEQLNFGELFDFEPRMIELHRS